jgi:hypothetical protein
MSKYIDKLMTDVDNHRRFYELLDCRKPMNAYQEGIKLNHEKNHLYAIYKKF